jgi:hypothetical protein
MASEDDTIQVAGFADAPESRGVAAMPEDSTATRPISRSNPAITPVFVDETGRRGRLLGLLGLGLSVVALLMLAVMWWSQVAATSG